jgi:hypothetical protein
VLGLRVVRKGVDKNLWDDGRDEEEYPVHIFGFPTAGPTHLQIKKPIQLGPLFYVVVIYVGDNS